MTKCVQNVIKINFEEFIAFANNNKILQLPCI